MFKRFRWLLCLFCVVFVWTSQASTNVPDLQDSQLQAAYWQQKLASVPKVTMTPQQIADFNQQLFASNPYMFEPLKMAETMDAATLRAAIDSISSQAQSPRFYADGSELSKADWQVYQDNLALDAIKPQNPLQYGLIVSRSVLRTFPTMDRVFNAQMDLDLDRFQESGLFPGEAVAILHHSRDQQWLLVRNYHYTAWMPRDAVAIADKSQIEPFVDARQFLVVTGARVLTSFVPSDPDVSQVVLDMGVKLPLLDDSQQQQELYGQTTSGNYQVLLPTRNQDGRLVLKTALIGRTQDVSQGYLSLTPQNVIAQAFKFLGERYGWGHDYNGRDCTGFVGEIYKTFGLLMPRNSGQQGGSDYGTNFRFAADTGNASKLAVIEQMQVGDLIYIPGHVMMYLGSEDGQPFIIHDVKGLAYWKPDGTFYTGVLNAVSVTPLIKLSLNPHTTYLDKIYNIKRLSPSTGS